MTAYLHHTPGRLRLRLRRPLLAEPQQAEAEALRERLYRLPQVREVQVNWQAASFTVHYLPAAGSVESILALFAGEPAPAPAAAPSLPSSRPAADPWEHPWVQKLVSHALERSLGTVFRHAGRRLLRY